MQRFPLALIVAALASPALAQPADVEALRAELARARAQLDAQERRLRALEARLGEPSASSAVPAAPRPGAPASAPAIASTATTPGDPGTIAPAPVERVGQAPEVEEAPVVAVLGDQGSAITRRGQLTAEAQFEYARADRNRAIFRGIEIVESVLLGVFDINESRQDVLTAAGSLRYGLTNRLEIGVRVPYVYRDDTSILAPIAGSTTNDPARTVDSSADGRGIGDVEFSARYQLTSARGGWPFLIANLQAVAPTGTDPFEVRRDELGSALEAATGSGFWGVSPSVTAILPTDPAVLFGTFGYTKNFGHDVDTFIPPVRITRVEPGDALSFSAGIGISLNQRTSLNLGYAHSWAFGTRTETITQSGPLLMPVFTEGSATSRDLQLGRLLFGVTYRATNRAAINWAVEVGATDDATDLRTVLRIPLTVLSGR